jgi:hypothetical protein
MPQKKALSWWVYPFFLLLFHDKEYFREINIDFFMFLLVYLEKKNKFTGILVLKFESRREKEGNVLY